MKANTGRLGASFNEPPFDYTKLFNTIVMIIIVIVGIALWLGYSNKQDERRSQSFDSCLSSFRSGIISPDYELYMQDCMR